MSFSRKILTHFPHLSKAYGKAAEFTIVENAQSFTSLRIFVALQYPLYSVHYCFLPFCNSNFQRSRYSLCSSTYLLPSPPLTKFLVSLQIWNTLIEKPIRILGQLFNLTVSFFFKIKTVSFSNYLKQKWQSPESWTGS